MRTIILLTASLFVGAALACGDNANCTSSMCSKPPSTAAVDGDVDTAEGTKVALAVTGMSCGACADKVHAALMGVEGVKAAKVDVSTGHTDVAYDAAKTDVDKLIAAVAAVGHFEAKKIEPKTIEG